MRSLVTLVVLVLAGRVHAQALSWRAPAPCPDASTVRARIEHRLGGPLDDFVVHIQADVAVANSQFVARIAGGGEPRTLTSASCDELVDAVSLIAARIARERPRATMRLEASNPPAPEPRPWNIGARVSALTGVGVLPGAGFGAEVAIALRGPYSFVELSQTRWLPRTAAGLRHALDITGVRIGWRPLAPIRVWLGAEGGTIRSGGAREPTSMSTGDVSAVSLATDERAANWLAGGAGIAFELRLLGWLRVVGATEATYGAEIGVLSYTPSRLSLRASCGIELGW